MEGSLVSDQPPQVQPQPVPMTFTCGPLRAESGALFVVMQVSTPTGTAVYFLDEQLARRVGAMLVDASRSSGLIVPVVDVGNGKHT